MLLGSDRKLSKSEMTRFRIFTRCEIFFEGDTSYVGGKSYFYGLVRVIGEQKEKLREIAEKNGLRVLKDQASGLLDSAYEEQYARDMDYGF